MEIRIQKQDSSKLKPRPTDESKLGFGQIFTDHLFMMEYDPDRGWHDPRVEPYANLSLDPATIVLHYGQAIFEGLKAYRGQDDGIYLFRHRKNLERFASSADRLQMPEFPADMLEEGIRQLVLLDRDWIPKAHGTSLYIRPTLIGVDPFLGVRPSHTYRLFVIVGPVGAYYAEGFNPIKIQASEEYVRAVRGGVGEAKCAGNYAASLKAQMEAVQQGYSQVLWLDGIERKYVEEVGAMNMFFLFGDKLVTAPLGGSILPGITRDSVIHLCRADGLEVDERPLTIDEVTEGAASGKLTEAFGSGTAAIISPVGAISYKGAEYTINDNKVGDLSSKLYDRLLAMQCGQIEAPEGWVERID